MYQLEVYARVKQGQETYSLEAAASGTLTIIEGLSLNNISFFISYENKALSDVRLGGTLTLTQSNVELFLQAEYQYDNGWQFIGSTGTDQQIPIGSLITDIVEKFEVDQTLPAPLTGLTIENLYVSFNTKSKDFTFSGRADFPINGTNFDIKINIAITHLQEGGFEKRFGGHLTIGTTIPLQFDLVFDKNPEKSLMLAGYHDAAGHNISLKDLLQSLMGDVKIPDVLTFSLNDALLVYDKESTATTSKQLFVAHIGSGIDLSNLPLIGKLFPPNQTINLAYQILVTSTDFSKEIIAAVNTLMPEGISTLANDKDISERLSLATSIQLGSETIQLDLPVVVNQDPTAENPDPVKSTADSVEPKWFNLKKTFGPVHFNRIGVTYKESKLKFLLDASLAAGGLTISLDGLSVSSPLTRFEPQFDLKGLGIDYTNDALEIGGAFLRQHIVDGNREYDEYDGLAIIKLEKFTIGAIGSYAYVDNHPSLFIYASINEPIGGPAFFFVTGLSAGFGYNRSLRIPSIDNVASFPLVADAMKGETPPTNAGKDFLAAKLAALRDYIPPTPGEMFLAVGVKFTSFKLIESFALLTLSFGNRFEIDLLGISTLIVPPQQAKTPLAEIQMAFKATYVPDEGFLGVNAQLTPHSYILSKDCRLTGGFAFYSWFSGEHKGDFVTTLGGYHPEFNVPSHYPVVPRLGFNWIVNDHFHIKGDAYFALCPHALMAGGHLEAVYESGSFKAWFKEGADFLVAWKPYHYDANIYADIGASLTYHFFGTHHITIQVGANVHIWGPEFGGDATVKIWILTFHITFGDQSSQQPGPIDWNTFRNSFLPGDTTKICSVVAAGGLVTQGSDSNDLGVVNPKELILRTDSVIPTKRASVPLEADKVNTNFGIGSMEISANDLKSTQTITIQRKENNTWKTLKTDFSYKPILKKVPAGLWGTQLNPPLNGARFIDNALTGFEITPAKSPCPGQTKPVNRDYFKYETHAVKNSFGWEERKPFNPSKPSDDDPRAKINRTIMETATSTKRSNLLQALGVDWPIDLNDRAADDFLFVPQIQEVAA
ncbi:MAG: hypothetical protein GTO45_25255 [Candidatus Aminicenantes bacterium]|nr:hypothetical protein [Candidatus Aminicenantes bacterium]NIM82052.1 hypothetical protein [Candidatus Aminicenantes bacterium]NIN21450.1 hypothetical protein [Candidatus Aminicenantes bacterium]NIN45262.1 hypothetical protein [Candidatus Aminicenantes bacterium]NIN88079.1 hypothetical protein [Candidatus Aminicenantes bacterium]